MLEAALLAALAVAVFFALRHIRRGGLSCGGDCGKCALDCSKKRRPPEDGQ